MSWIPLNLNNKVCVNGLRKLILLYFCVCGSFQIIRNFLLYIFLRVFFYVYNYVIIIFNINSSNSVLQSGIFDKTIISTWMHTDSQEWFLGKKFKRKYFLDNLKSACNKVTNYNTKLGQKPIKWFIRSDLSSWNRTTNLNPNQSQLNRIDSRTQLEEWFNVKQC